MNVINHSNHLTIQYLENFWIEDAIEFEWKVYNALYVNSPGRKQQKAYEPSIRNLEQSFNQK